MCSVMSDSVTPWTVARQAPLSVGFSRRLCDPMDHSPPGSSVRGILQARMGCHAILQGIFLTQGWNSYL